MNRPESINKDAYTRTYRHEDINQYFDWCDEQIAERDKRIAELSEALITVMLEVDDQIITPLAEKYKHLVDYEMEKTKRFEEYLKTDPEAKYSYCPQCKAALKHAFNGGKYVGYCNDCRKYMIEMPDQLNEDGE